jgi:hypothetical protein
VYFKQYIFSTQAFLYNTAFPLACTAIVSRGQFTNHTKKPNLGTGIKQTNAGIGILAFIILIWYRTKKMPVFIG